MTTKVLTHVHDVAAVRMFTNFGAGFVEIAHLVDIQPPSPDRKVIDTSDIDTNGYTTYAPGLIEPGKVSLVVNFNPSDPTHDAATGLLSMFANLNFYPFQVRWPDETNDQWDFTGFLTGVKPDAKLGAKVTATIDIQVSGAINYDAGPWAS